MIIGITRGTSSGHIARAALEGVALGIADALEAMEKDSGRAITELRVDGTSATYDFFMQMQTDILQYPVMRPQVMPSGATGVAYLAGLATSFWTLQQIREQYTVARTFSPNPPAEGQAVLREKWQKAIARVKNWDF
jgi:glycerol kinase